MKKLSCKDIDAMLTVHEEWLTSRGTKGQCASFVGCLLTEADLDGADLSYADFTNVIIVDSSVRGAVLTHAIAYSSRWHRTDLSYTKAHGIGLSKSYFDQCNLSETSFYGATITDSIIKNSDLSNCNFKNASLANSRLTEVIISTTNWTDTKLTGARIKEKDSSSLLFLPKR